MIRPVIMCKAPAPGAVKTRLMPDYGACQAAELHAAMAAAVIDRCARLLPHAWIAADDPGHAFFRHWRLRVLAQGNGDLGRRMERLLVMACGMGATGVLFLGTDSPHMSEARILHAIDGLRGADVVLGPVEDGGYDLIALGGMHRALFTEIAWSGSAVLSQTLRAARSCGLSVRLLSTGFDVDRPQDVRRAVRAGWREGEKFLLRR